MDKLKALLREPALLIDAFESVVVFAIAMGFLNLTGDQQTNVVAAFIAVLAFAKGFLTSPFPVTVVTDLGRALLVACVSLGMLHVTPDQITVAVTMLGTLMTVVQRAQITPRFDPVVRPGGAGAGPVAGLAYGEEGAAEPLYIVGVILVVLGLLDLLLLALGTAFLSLIWAILLIVIGAVLIYLSRGHSRL